MTQLRRRTVLLFIVAPLLSSAFLHAHEQEKAWKVLIVVAHPDDEYYFAATAYRLTQELGATVDQVIVTNGEAGFRYSTLAERVYGIPLTDERTGRSRLPEIRRKEALAAGRILGIRRHYFLGQRDQRFTLNAGEAIEDLWDCGKIRQALRALLAREQYDFVFTILPRESTHGHHQAATALALEVVGTTPPSRRPVVLGAEPAANSEPEPFQAGASRPDLATASERADFRFDRRREFGYQGALRYDIVVNWVISEHKSQGMFQNEVNKHEFECFWRFAAGPEDAVERTRAFASQINAGEQTLRKAANQ